MYQLHQYSYTNTACHMGKLFILPEVSHVCKLHRNLIISLTIDYRVVEVASDNVGWEEYYVCYIG